MEYLTVRETSEKWGMSIRMVNYYLNTGRIEGAVRKKKVNGLFHTQQRAL